MRVWTRRVPNCVPEGVEYHGEEHELAQERHHQRRRRDDLGQQQEEHSERQQDRDGEAHLKQK